MHIRRSPAPVRRTGRFLPSPAARDLRARMGGLLAILLASALLLLVGPLAAQQCARVEPGDDLRFQSENLDVKGSIVALGEDHVRVRIRGVEQTLDRWSTLRSAEVKCRLTEFDSSNLLRSILGGALIGAATGWAVGSIIQEPAPAPEQRCAGWFGCWTYQAPAPTPPVNIGNGFLVGAGVGLIWGVVRSGYRGWAPLSSVGSDVAVEPTVKPTPGEPGAWSVGLRVPLGGRP